MIGMKNNNGKGLYEIGEVSILPCGCEVVAEAKGYTHYINPECKYCNIYHPQISGYNYKLSPK